MSKHNLTVSNQSKFHALKTIGDRVAITKHHVSILMIPTQWTLPPVEFKHAAVRLPRIAHHEEDHHNLRTGEDKETVLT
jgi:hypothetical protein